MGGWVCCDVVTPLAGFVREGFVAPRGFIALVTRQELAFQGYAT